MHGRIPQAGIIPSSLAARKRLLLASSSLIAKTLARLFDNGKIGVYRTNARIIQSGGNRVKLNLSVFVLDDSEHALRG